MKCHKFKSKLGMQHIEVKISTSQNHRPQGMDKAKTWYIHQHNDG